MAADEKADADLFHDFVLADDHAADLPDDLGIDFAETCDPGFQNIRLDLRGDDSGHVLFQLFRLRRAHFEQQLLSRLEIRRGFERGNGFLSGLVFLACGLKGLCKIVMAARDVDRIHSEKA